MGRCLRKWVPLLFICVTLAATLEAQGTPLTIVHTNDLHSHLQDFGPELDYSPGSTGDDATLGGAARIGTLIRQVRESRGGRVTGPTPSTEKSDLVSQTFYPPHAYVTYGMESGLAFGIGLYAPYGLGTEWEEDWPGRYLGVKTDLQALYINPTVAYRFSPKLSAGAGFSYIMGDVSLTRKMNINPAQLPDWDMKLEGDGTAFTFNLGLLYKATEKLSLGLSYRHLLRSNLKAMLHLKVFPMFRCLHHHIRQV